jgi:hypothetical protein
MLERAETHEKLILSDLHFAFIELTNMGWMVIEG